MEVAPKYANLADVLLIYDNTTIAEPEPGWPAAGPDLLVDVTPEGAYISRSAHDLARGEIAVPDALRAMLATLIADFDS